MFFKNSEYDQEIPLSQTAYNPIAPRKFDYLFESIIDNYQFIN